MAYQYKKLPTDLAGYKISEMADALKSLEYALNEIEKRAPKD